MNDEEQAKIDRDLEICGVAYSHNGKRLDPREVVVYHSPEYEPEDDEGEGTGEAINALMYEFYGKGMDLDTIESNGRFAFLGGKWMYVPIRKD